MVPLSGQSIWLDSFFYPAHISFSHAFSEMYRFLMHTKLEKLDSKSAQKMCLQKCKKILV
jgi:hypothetical protein